MTTTVLKVNINDLDKQFFQDLGKNVSDTAEVEIHISKKKQKKALFSDEQFWEIIESLDWSKNSAPEIMAPAIRQLADMPVVNIYLFADKLAEKLYLLDTRQHGNAYLIHQADDYLSVDDFLYVRCAVVAEGKAYFEKILKNPVEFPSDISFEPLLNLADKAYLLKTGRDFNYYPVFNYETYSNKAAWK